MKDFLRIVCAFVGLAGCWLAVMELILHRPGYPLRLAVDLFLTAQAGAICFASPQNRALRAALLIAALAAGAIGLSAIVNAVQSPHFEGYAVLIGAALVIEALLAAIVLARPSVSGRTNTKQIA